MNFISSIFSTRRLDLVYFNETLLIFFEKSGLSYPKGYLGSMKRLQPEQIDEISETLIRSHYLNNGIKNILQKRLSPCKIPVEIIFVPRIPRTLSGEVEEKALDKL